MAEGGVEESATAIQETSAALCDVCLDEDSVRPSVSYCQQCRQGLCDKCRNFHTTWRKDHTLIQAGAVSATSTHPQGLEEGIPDEYRVPICHLHNVPVEFYCQKHNAPVCSTCKLLGHRKCLLQDLENAATGTTGSNMEALQEMREMEAQLGMVQEAMGSEKKSLEVKKSRALDDIKRAMKRIEVLGQKNVTEVETVFRKECASLDKENRALSQSKQLIQKSIKELERVKIVGSEQEIFVAMKRAEEDVKQFQDIVHDAINVPHTKIKFNPRDEHISSLGFVQSWKYDVKCKSTVSVTEVLKTKHFAMNVDVLWFDVLPSEKLILLSNVIIPDDYWDGDLDLYSADGTRLHHMTTINDEVKCTTGSAAMLNDHQLIMPKLAENKAQLQIVDIHVDDLRKGPVINTDVSALLILKYSDSSVLVLACEDNNWVFQILDLTGKIQWRTKISRYIIELSNPVTMRMSSDKATVYIVDTTKGCFGFSLKGTCSMLFNYTYRDYEYYEGLAVDQHGALYFSAGNRKEFYDPACIIKLSPAGQKLQRINVRQIPEQCIGKKLYLRCLDGCDNWNINYIYI